MCGRYAITLPPEAMAKAFGVGGALPNIPPHYNAVPGQSLPVVRRGERGGRALDLMTWGLVPSWSKGPDTRYSMINARAETATERPAYRGPFRNRRCLVPAGGFYEWRKTDGARQPWYFTLRSGELLAFAGLWDHWMGAGGEEILSFTIVVTDANDVVRPIHHRMPVILAPEHYARWLGEDDAPIREVIALMAPFPASTMMGHPVSRRVNSPANDDAGLLEPVSLEEPGRLL